MSNKVITLIGSTKFKDVWDIVNVELSIQGHAVFSVAIFGHLTGMDMNGPIKRALDKSYLKKIDISDAVFIVNPGGYIGLGACDEIHYAIAQEKEIYWLEEPAGWKEYFSAYYIWKYMTDMDRYAEFIERTCAELQINAPGGLDIKIDTTIHPRSRDMPNPEWMSHPNINVTKVRDRVKDMKLRF